MKKIIIKCSMADQAFEVSLLIFYVLLRFIGSGKMLETIAIILIILWALGLVTSVTMGGLVHVLLVLAIVVILIRVIQGRRV